MSGLADKLQTGVSDNDEPVWKTTTNPQIHSSFPDKTVAVVIDVRQQIGALRIFENDTGKYLDGVGTEEKGKLVMIPWNKTWNYDTVGSIRLGYILQR